MPMGAANDVTQATMFDSMQTTVPATESQHGQPEQQARDSIEACAIVGSLLMPKVHRNSPSTHGTLPWDAGAG